MSIKLKLITPKKKQYERELFDGKFVSLLYGVEKYSCFSLSLATIAAITPKDIEIQIIDENIETVNFDDPADIVGITVNTSVAPRAYEIAEEYRNRNVTVIMGGVHPSVLPEEALKHCDSIVIGEAELVWNEFISDYRNKKVKQIYTSENKPDLKDLPLPRRDLLKNSKYSFHVIQTTRGCPFNCDFCSVKILYGSKYRCKSIDKIVEEVKDAIAIEKKLIFFSDDNFIGNKSFTKELLKLLIPLKIVYFIQSSINVADDNEMLDLLSKSGCRKICIGLESISDSNLRLMNKAYCNQVDTYAKHIEKLQAYGFEIESFIIFGCDYDDDTVFEKTLKFIEDTNIIFPVPSILTPYPGTKVYENIKAENRVLHTNWSLYDTTHVCFKPKLMSPEALQNGYIWVRQQLYSYDNLFKRLKKLWGLWNTNNVRKHDRISPMIASLSMNDVNYSLPKAVHPREFSN